MLLPPAGAAAAQLPGAWTHQSLTESLVFFFFHVQGLKIGRIGLISSHFFTFFVHLCKCLFFLTLSSRSIRCFSSDTRMLSLQDTSHQTTEEPETWSKHHLLLASPLINSERSFIRNWSWYLSNFNFCSVLIVRRVWLCACGLWPLPQLPVSLCCCTSGVLILNTCKIQINYFMLLLFQCLTTIEHIKLHMRQVYFYNV